MKLMQLVLDDLEVYAPVTLRGPRMTDDEFLAFCQEHEDLQIESNAFGEIELMPGTGPDTGDSNAEITHQLRSWAKRDGRGKSYDSSTLFVLPDGSRRSPDASWIEKTRARLPESQHGHLWHICPDFVIELRSPSDRLPRLQNKMREWITAGVRLGWLIDPEERTVSIYRPDREPEVLRNPATVAAGDPLGGFTLDLGEVWGSLAP